MLGNILVIVGVIELVSHFCGYGSSATVMLVKAGLTRLHTLVQAVLGEKK